MINRNRGREILDEFLAVEAGQAVLHLVAVVVALGLLYLAFPGGWPDYLIVLGVFLMHFRQTDGPRTLSWYMRLAPPTCQCCNGLIRKMPCITTKLDGKHGRFIVYAEYYHKLSYKDASACFIAHTLDKNLISKDSFHPQLVITPTEWHLLRRHGINMHRPSIDTCLLECIREEVMCYDIGSIQRSNKSTNDKVIWQKPANHVEDVYDMVVDYLRHEYPTFDPEHE